MNFKELIRNKWFKIFSNIYVLILSFFVIWMLFFDTNSWLTHRELSKEIKKLEKQRQHLLQEINEDKPQIEKLNTLEGIEKFGREAYYLKKENEEIYLIEYDSTEK